MKIKHLRHGSHILNYKGVNLLVDPVFAEKGTMVPLPMGRVKEKNPLTPFPIDLSFIDELDALVITHMHFDHFDDVAINLLPKTLPVICSKVDEKKINKLGFTNTVSIENKTNYKGINITITGGEHGKGLRKKLMGNVAGYIFSDSDNQEPTTYLVGDSIWCNEIESNIKKYNPKVITLFTGEAKLMGKAITMGTYDIDKVAKESNAEIVNIHMDTWNHCFLTKDGLQSFIQDKNYEERIHIPNDGEELVFE